MEPAELRDIVEGELCVLYADFYTWEQMGREIVLCILTSNKMHIDTQEIPSNFSRAVRGGDLPTKSYRNLFNTRHDPRSELRSFFTILKCTVEYPDSNKPMDLPICNI